MGVLTFASLATLITRIIARRKQKNDQKCAEKKSGRAVTRVAPLLAGIGVSFSLLIEIPVLTRQWSQAYMLPTEIPLNAGLLISLFLGVLANASLIFRYFECRVQLSTFLAIGTLTLHDIINIIILIYLGLKDYSNYYPKIGWMMLASTIVSVACNISLVVDYVFVENFQAKGSGLTTKQRTLIIAAMSLLLYCGLGAMLFIFLENKKIDFDAALYFSVCTITTVGFGDITPTTAVSRIYIFFFTIFGIVLLAISVSSTYEIIAEAFEALYRSRRDRIVEKIRKRKFNQRNNTRGAQCSDSPLKIVGNADINYCRNSLTSRPVSVEQGKSMWDRIAFGASQPTKNTAQGSGDSSLGDDNLIKSYKDFQKLLKRQETKEFQKRLATTLVIFFCFWLLGGVVFKYTEGWSYGDALYFGYVSFLTLGYGDLKVTSSHGRAFFIAWLLFGIGNMTLLLSVLTELWKVKYKCAIGKRRRKNFLLRNKTLSRCETDAEEAKPADCELGIQSNTEPQNSLDEVEDTLKRLVKTAKSFLSHAHYWMNSKTGEPPPELVKLMSEIENADHHEIINGPEIFIEQIASRERQKQLFLISFARTFENLTKLANESSIIFEENMKELRTLRKLQDQCSCKRSFYHEDELTGHQLNLTSAKDSCNSSHLYVSEPEKYEDHIPTDAYFAYKSKVHIEDESLNVNSLIKSSATIPFPSGVLNALNPSSHVTHSLEENVDQIHELPFRKFNMGKNNSSEQKINTSLKLTKNEYTGSKNLPVDYSKSIRKSI